jgi:hypothetical protein
MEAEDATKAEGAGGAAGVVDETALAQLDAGPADGDEDEQPGWEDDPELDALKKKVKQMQEEAEGERKVCARVAGNSRSLRSVGADSAASGAVVR